MAKKNKLPKRLENKCKKCKYTWHPRGHAKSHKCPRCGSEKVKQRWVLELFRSLF
jgi:predicted RNA-binding Zn-ribbon protein involved in translation (DUF1610 family)